MPKFNFVLVLDDDEKALLNEASAVKVYSAAVKSHEAQLKNALKSVTKLVGGQFTMDDLAEVQRAIPQARQMAEALADSDEKQLALEQLDTANQALSEVRQAVESAHPGATA